MSPQVVTIIFQIAVLLFAISLHEAAHAWMASRLGDQTARMLGRVTLNPIKHIDPIGTILFPLLAAISHFPMIGWAKPTPVNTRNFKHYVRDDILTTLAGPASNLLAAMVSLIALLLIKYLAPGGMTAIIAAVGAMSGQYTELPTSLYPLALLFCYGILLNLFLAVFNLLPLPPLDGSHVVRHMLPYNVVPYFDRLGMFSLIILFLFGGRFIGYLTYPVIAAFFHVLGF
jgi:Zn-dependent protease